MKKYIQIIVLLLLFTGASGATERTYNTTYSPDGYAGVLVSLTQAKERNKSISTLSS